MLFMRSWCYLGVTAACEIEIMSTTSLKLPPELKERVSAAARSQGLTTHAFMIEAVRRATTVSETRARAVADAQAALAATREDGRSYDADEVHAYVRARLRGVAADRPNGKPWRK